MDRPRERGSWSRSRPSFPAETYPSSVSKNESRGLELRPSGIVSPFVIGDGDDHTEAKRHEHLCSCVDAASGADVPEAAVLAGFVCSFFPHPAAFIGLC